MGAMQITPAVWIHERSSLSVRAIETISEMIAFLEHWPYARRGTAYQVAVDIAHKAAVGLVTPDAARDAFRDFAGEAGILAESRRP